MSAEPKPPTAEPPTAEPPASEPPATEQTEPAAAEKGRGSKEKKGPGFVQRVLGFIERVGNKVPHPAIMFIALCVGIIILSQILAWVGVSATFEVVAPPPVSVEEGFVGGSTAPIEVLPPEQTDAEDYEVVTETVEIQSLLDGDGVRFLFTSFVSNFMGFTAMGIILIVMIGVGLSEASGLIGALIRKLVAVSSARSLTYIIVFIGIISSIASDAGYLVLIPLGAAAFMSVGRHPLAGMAAAFAGVAGGFGVNFLITPTDAVLTEIANESIALVDPARSIDITANLWFGIGSTILLTIVLGLVSTRIIEPRLGTYDHSLAPANGTTEAAAEAAQTLSPAQEAKGLRWAGVGILITVVVIALLTFIPGAPLRDPETGSIIGTSPFMDSLIVLISIVFLVAGAFYGKATGTIKNATDGIKMITKGWAGLAGLLFLFLLIAQFIAYFNYSNIPQVIAVSLGETARGTQHQQCGTAHPGHAHHPGGGHHHAAGNREVGAARSHLHPAVPAPGHRAAVGAGRLPGGRLAYEHLHAHHGLLPADRGVREPLRQELGDRDRDRPHAALLPHHDPGVDHLLRDLVRARHPHGTGCAGLIERALGRATTKPASRSSERPASCLSAACDATTSLSRYRSGGTVASPPCAAAFSSFSISFDRGRGLMRAGYGLCARVEIEEEQLDHEHQRHRHQGADGPQDPRP